MNSVLSPAAGLSHKPAMARNDGLFSNFMSMIGSRKAARINDVWSLDSVFGRTTSGTTLKWLSIVQIGRQVGRNLYEPTGRRTDPRVGSEPAHGRAAESGDRFRVVQASVV